MPSWLFLVAIMPGVGEVCYCHLLGGPGKCRQSLTGRENNPSLIANNALVKKELRYVELH